MAQSGYPASEVVFVLIHLQYHKVNSCLGPHPIGQIVLAM